MGNLFPLRPGFDRARPVVVAAAGLAVTAVIATVFPAGAETPPGVEQIIPRGTLAAIFEPRFVPAADAGVPDRAWILGIEIDGEARAYDLNLLNEHEVVNDVVGGRPIAAVW